MTTSSDKTTALAALALVAMLALASAGCGSLVGEECRAGLSRCGHLCIDLSSDRANCGACGHACVGAALCIGGVCGGTADGGGDDGGAHDAGHDASGTGIDASIDSSIDASGVDVGAIDAGTLDASADDGGAIDAAVADANVDGGGPACGLGELLCGTSCVDPNDPAHCGDCTTMCTAAQVCAAGTCTTSCAPLTDCGTFCADLTNDPDHCGTCTNSCGSGICVAGTCEAALAGHLVVIGHDYEQRRLPMSSILANAVLLPGRASVRVLVWEGSATARAVTGTYAAIVDGAGSRVYTTMLASTPGSVPVLLDTSDTFLVLGQADATDSGLMGLGTEWSAALDQFLNRGGVVVVLEAPSTTNVGTFQILSSAGLFAATSITELIHPVLATVTGHAGDPVLIGVPLSYRGEIHTVFYATSDPDAIVASTSGPVVFDRTVTPP